MSRVEKIIDRINRWGSFAERLWSAASLFGWMPWLAGAIVFTLAWLGGWAATATIILRILAPFSYLVAALILAILGVVLFRVILGRRDRKAKEQRVEFWTTYEYAPLLLSSAQLRMQYDAARQERDRHLLQDAEQKNAKSERIFALSSRSDGYKIPPASAFANTPEEDQTKRALSDAEWSVSRLLTQMKQEVEHGLLEGTLVAKGYRGTLKEHDQIEAPIPVSQWVVLKADAKEKNVVRGDGTAYSGVQVGRPISVWEAFRIRLRGAAR